MPDPAVQSYEQQFWEIPRANGYEYEVEVVVFENGQWTPTTSRFYLVGILDSDASPPYLMSPPAWGAVRKPSGSTAFGPTSYDFSAEENITRSAAFYGAPPVLSDSYACVTVLDASYTPIDFFPLAGRHDPSGQPW